MQTPNKNTFRIFVTEYKIGEPSKLTDSRLFENRGIISVS